MIMELADETPHAYVPFRPAVKSSQPHDNVFVCKDKHLWSYFQEKNGKNAKKKYIYVYNYQKMCIFAQ